MSRFVDRGAITAAWVGVGMALTIGVSFLLVIPIEPIFWYLMVPAGILIGYYANQRSDRRAGPWTRILANAGLAGIATGVTAALLLLAVKALFFAADGGYPDFNRIDDDRNPIQPYCDAGADCVYQRYLADGRGPELARLGVTDLDGFTGFYWEQQLNVAGAMLVFSTVGALAGGLAYVRFRPTPDEEPAGGAPRAAGTAPNPNPGV